MQGFFDVNIAHISVIIQKRENSEFIYRCSSRQKSGFVFVTNGIGHYEDSTLSIPIRKYTLLTLDQGAKYTIRSCSDDFTYITTAFDAAPENCFSALGLPVYMELEQHRQLISHFDQLLNTWTDRSELYLPKSRMLLTQILIDLFEIHSENTMSVAKSGRLQPAIIYINRCYDQEISTKKLAALCSLSISHFRRVFKEKTGLSPLQYREQVRIHWAKQMLKSDLLTVSEVAVKLGYYDVYHFSNDFRKHTGISPKQYARAVTNPLDSSRLR